MCSYDTCMNCGDLEKEHSPVWKFCFPREADRPSGKSFRGFISQEDHGKKPIPVYVDEMAGKVRQAEIILREAEGASAVAEAKSFRPTRGPIIYCQNDEDI